MKVLLSLISIGYILQLILAKDIWVLDENSVCNVKKSCLDCLRLPQCSWCNTDSTCFSRNSPGFEEFCTENNTEIVDYGLSFEDNALCACAGDLLERNCYPPGVFDGPECFDRGSCICGRCICNPDPDPEHPTKMVMGEFCEYDNFSCDGPKCNEGPYSLSERRTEEGDLEEI